MSTTSYFEMSQGKEVKMYTLWKVTITGGIYNRRFIQNLSTDHTTAIKKAQRWAEKAQSTVIDDSVDSLNAILKGDDVVRFGKNNNKRISECPQSFIDWVAQCGPLKHKETGNRYEYFSSDNVLVTYARKISLEKGTLVIFDGKFVSPAYVTAVQKKSEGFGHHLGDKNKVQLTLKLSDWTGYDSNYGYVCVYIFVDSDGRKFTYKGANVPGYYDGDGYHHSVREHEGWFTVKCTIKHDTYRENAVTYIQRPKFILVG